MVISFSIDGRCWEKEERTAWNPSFAIQKLPLTVGRQQHCLPSLIGCDVGTMEFIVACFPSNTKTQEMYMNMDEEKGSSCSTGLSSSVKDRSGTTCP